MISRSQVKRLALSGAKPKYDPNDPAQREIIRQAMGLIGSISTPKKARAVRRNGKNGGRPHSAKWPTGTTGALRYHMRNIEKQGGAALTPAQARALATIAALRKKHNQ